MLSYEKKIRMHYSNHNIHALLSNKLLECKVVCNYCLQNNEFTAAITIIHLFLEMTGSGTYTIA